MPLLTPRQSMTMNEEVKEHTNERHRFERKVQQGSLLIREQGDTY